MFRFKLSSARRIEMQRLLGVGCGVLLLIALNVRGDEQPSPEQDIGKQRLQIMQQAIDSMAVTSEEIEDQPTLEFSTTPLLRYSDETRNLLDAGVWRLGESGRPTALVTMEIYGLGEGRGLLTYEFLSLAADKFTMMSTRARWEATVTDLRMSDLQDAPEPADSERGRLQQMRQLARRFTASEELGDDRVELRLMPQPIDRYRASEAGISDGAVFFLSNGTNPELALLLETDGKKWRYGVARLAAAALRIELDDVVIAEIPRFTEYGVARKYTAMRHTVQLPAM